MRNALEWERHCRVRIMSFRSASARRNLLLYYALILSALLLALKMTPLV